jgi:hypothetical protein
MEKLTTYVLDLIYGKEVLKNIGYIKYMFSDMLCFDNMKILLSCK